MDRYYRMKIGKGNVFFSLFKEYSKLFDEEGGLWIGWDLETYNNPFDKNKKKQIQELVNLKNAIEQKDKIVIWDYDQQEISFWQLTGDPPQKVPESFFLAYTDRFPENSKDKTKKSKQNIEESIKYDSLNPKADYEYFKNWINSGSMVPAKEICSIKRSNFPAFIDSLSVYYYLNAGTIRPINNLMEEKNIDCSFLDKKPPTTQPESKFSYLVRMYFDHKILNNKEKKELLFADRYSINTEEIEKVVLSCMSPAQLETFASLLLLDMGLILDFGVGKSMDSFDLRATFKGKHDSFFDNLILKLEYLGADLTKNFKNELKETKILFVQCKMYASSLESENILMLEGLGNKNVKNVSKKNTISLEKISDRIREKNDNFKFPLVKEWLDHAVSNF